jgi:hypothetical protein
MKEFEELQRIWDSQNNKPVYVMNEEALFRRVTTKKDTVVNTTTVNEWLLIIINLLAGSFILFTDFPNAASVFMRIMGIWMLAVAAYVASSRILRINNGRKYDRTLRGELAHAIAVAAYQVRLSYLMKLNIVPIAVLILLGLWAGEKSLWIGCVTCIFFVLAFYLGRWEHKIYVGRKNELETLQAKLVNEN